MRPPPPTASQIRDICDRIEFIISKEWTEGQIDLLNETHREHMRADLSDLIDDYRVSAIDRRRALDVWIKVGAAWNAIIPPPEPPMARLERVGMDRLAILAQLVGYARRDHLEAAERYDRDGMTGCAMQMRSAATMLGDILKGGYSVIKPILGHDSRSRTDGG